MKHLITIISCFAVLSMSAQVPGYVPQGDLVAWYDFADGACDVSGLAGCFDLIDGAHIEEVEGSDDLALRLDGNYAELPADPSFNLTEFTIAFRYFYDEGSQMRMWKGNPDYPDDVNYAIKSSDETILEHHFNYSLDCGSILDNSPNGFSNDAFESPGVWLDVVVTRSSAGVVSLNTLNSSDVFTGTPTICNETQPIRIGHWWDGDPSPSIGWVDHLGFWSTVLSEGEILQLLQRQTEAIGCTDASACNYNTESSWDDGSCDYFTCLCLDGTIWSEELGGCIPATTCPQDLDYDGVVGVNDLMNLLSAFGTPCEPPAAASTCGEPVTYRGYDYETVLIGDRCWFAENLRATKYLNGAEIENLQGGPIWLNANEGETGGWVDFANDTIYGALHGKMYNGYAVTDERGLCPPEWHVSTDLEWDVMIQSYGGEQLAGTALKDDELWNGDNTSGFSGLAGGFRDWGNAAFFDFGWTVGTWWTVNHETGTIGTTKRLIEESGLIYSFGFPETNGSYVRCIKD